MKLNTHNRTPKPKISKSIIFLFVLCAILLYGMFGLCAFVCIYYGKSLSIGLLVIFIAVLLTALLLMFTRDVEKAYIEIDGDTIRVVDYYCGIKKEKVYLFSDITSAEIVLGAFPQVKGYRIIKNGTQYIVFRNNKKYLFKIIRLPETEQLFKQFINN